MARSPKSASDRKENLAFAREDLKILTAAKPLWGFHAERASLLLGSVREKSQGSERRGEVIVLGSKSSDQSVQKTLSEHGAFAWQVAAWKHKTSECFACHVSQGPLWVVRPRLSETSMVGAVMAPTLPLRAKLRDLAGQVIQASKDAGLQVLQVRFDGCEAAEEQAFLLGLELAAYRFQAVTSAEPPTPLQLVLPDVSPDNLLAAWRVGFSMNLTRHLVNTPPADLNPKTMADGVAQWFSHHPYMEVDVWEGKKLAAEKMGLLIAVGQGATEGARLVHLRYRPKKNNRMKPIAFVGKGVTFDTGGLDIKPPSGMRLMKKDMGGSATVVGLAQWVSLSGLEVPCDFYLALAENSVDAHAFHPGDVITARSGLKVEIHNTDAEGRLVMADAIDVAVTAKGQDAPQALIDVSTLTGAMRVALGPTIGGVFSNHDNLAQKLMRASREVGDFLWPMPLFEDYRAMLRSTVADMSNASDSGFAGAVTAALFLQKFVGDVPWLHLDVYCWQDRPGGGCLESGGNGQALQALAQLLTTLQDSKGLV